MIAILAIGRHSRFCVMIDLWYHDPMRELRILSVEDEPSNGEIIEIILTSQGHRVTTVNNGQAALDRLQGQREPFDVVLMDIQMPVLDGLAATRQLRADPSTSQLAIICVSARASGSPVSICAMPRASACSLIRWWWAGTNLPALARSNFRRTAAGFR
ncbi:MAG: response regulator, partial [Candidatus Sericytochromatia bacterium]